MPSQAECADAQAVSTSPLAVSTKSQIVSTASPVSCQAIQAGSSQATNGTNSQGVSITSQLALRQSR